MAEQAREPRHRAQITRIHNESERPADAAAEPPLEPDVHPDRTRQFRTTSFSRMRLEWGPEDKIKIEEIHVVAERILKAKFAVAYDLRNRIWLSVRIPLMRDGEVVPGADGYPQWESHPNGSPVEDWGLLGDRERDQYLHEVTTHLFEWEQDAVKLWAEAMYAKVEWEQAFAGGYLAPTGRLTIDDRTQMGHNSSAEQRYFAIFRSALSRHADALIRSMKALEVLLSRTAR
jgi:hypothetical protein